MSRRLPLLTAGLALGVAGGLALMLHAKQEAPAAPDKEAPPKIAASKITNVTVYPNNALVTREVEVPAGTGTMELVVSPLPERTVNSTLYSEGADGTRVLTTRFRTRPVKENTREEVRKLEDEVKKLQESARKVQADLTACQQNMALLVKLEDFAAASTKNATEKGKLDSEATIALAKYLMEGRAEKTRERVGLEQQLANNSEQLAFVQRKLNEVSAGSSRTERDAVIVVDKADAAPGTVRLNYLVDAAQWRPQYKLRAGKTTKDPVLLEYLAAVMQHSGEDWRGVNLVLSTAQPMLNADPPEMKVLAVALVPRGTAVANLPPIPNPPNPRGGLGAGGGGMGRMGGVGGTGMPGGGGQALASQPMAQSGASYAPQFTSGGRNAF